MGIFREIITDGRTGKGSSKRAVFLAAGFSMSIAVIVLAVAACFGTDVGIAIGAVSTALAGFAGYGYVNGKKVEAMREGE